MAITKEVRKPIVRGPSIIFPTAETWSSTDDDPLLLSKERKDKILLSSPAIVVDRMLLLRRTQLHFLLLIGCVSLRTWGLQLENIFFFIKPLLSEHYIGLRD